MSVPRHAVIRVYNQYAATRRRAWHERSEFIMATDLYEVRAEWAGPPGAPWFTAMHFEIGGGSAQDAADAARTFLIAFQNHIISTCGISFDQEVLELDSTTGEYTGVSPVVVAAFGGAAAGDALPQGSSLNVRWRTGSFIGGREVRGRTYISGLVEGDNAAGGVPSAGILATASAAAAALVSDPDSRFAIYSRTHLASRPVTSGSGSNKWGYLRSRRD